MEKQQSNEPTRAKHRFLKALPPLASFAAFTASIWILAPAPSYNVWLFSVAASEWSFILGAFALFGIFGGLVFNRGNIKTASILAGAIAFLISLYPFISAFSAARTKNVSLSFQRYAAGFLTRNNKIGSETFTFANIGENQLQLDVYSPPNGVPKNGASVIVVHGGSWDAGGRGDFPRWNERLAENGYTVFDIDYRLEPQPNYLAATGDVKCAVGWVKSNAARFQISPDKIVLLGRSAGAHLALLAAYSANDWRLGSNCENYENDENPALQIPVSNQNVRGVVSFYAPVDLIWSYDNPANELVIDGKKTLRQFLGGSPHESVEMRERFLLASPDSHVNNETPPTLLIHGGQDQLVRNENMDLLDRRLKEANVPHEVLFLSYAQHGFDYNSDGWGAQVAESVLLDFLRENTASDK